MIIDGNNLVVATAASAFFVAALAALLSWGQRLFVPSQGVLALFFAAFALSELDNLTAVILETPLPSIRNGTEFVGFVANFFLGPLFFLYVRELTGLSNSDDNSKLDVQHLILPSVAIAFGVFSILFPAVFREIWNQSPMPKEPQVLRIGFLLFNFALFVQWAVYVIWVIRLQTLHIERLKQHFASTNGLELRWVAVLAIVLGFYVAQSLAGEILVALDFRDPVGQAFDLVLVLIIVLTLAVWSLRPAPALEEATTLLNDAKLSTIKKYQKSALGDHQADRIARKLLHAMEVDQLYRDPNLTLSTLARHVGVSLNYASQTLNQKIGQSFFEFVSAWRVKAAMPLIKNGEATVLAIALEVGFNSRSSFYSAFKRATGMTPTAYKTAQNAMADTNTSTKEISAL